MESVPEGFCLEDWMDMLVETGMDVILPPRVTKIPKPSAALTVNLEEDKLEVLKVSPLNHAIEAQLVTSANVLS